MKRISLIIISLLLFSISNGQNVSSDTVISSRIKSQGDSMCNFFLRKDFIRFTNFTYPKVIDMMGGKEKLIELLEKGSKEMDAASQRYIKVEIGKPSAIIDTDSELQCTVPQTIVMKVAEGKMVSTTTLIAISVDNGINWYFFDTSGNSIKALQKMLPNLSDGLMVPKPPQPIIYPE